MSSPSLSGRNPYAFSPVVCIAGGFFRDSLVAFITRYRSPSYADRGADPHGFSFNRLLECRLLNVAKGSIVIVTSSCVKPSCRPLNP